MLLGFRELSLLGVVIEMSFKKMDWYRVLLAFVCETMVNNLKMSFKFWQQSL